IILREVDWTGAPFSTLQMAPKDAKPVTSWSNMDEAFTDVARSIRRVISTLKEAVNCTTAVSLSLRPAVFLKLTVERLTINTEQFRGFFLLTFCELKRKQRVFAFEITQ